ncbi:unnamed protein product [Mytilus edulis]|uniref:Sushi domain-containing protein n=1 Tax=Mytilus edulis TaxID=6550 RepID=A0A8S3TFI5_MYTED|nr:unnamed protein product [Mytilus edulis]
MDDVCSADDDKCKKPNLSGVGMIEKGKCSLTGVLLRFRPMTLLDCAKKCFITSQCTSINYRQNWKLCDLVMSDDDGNEIADDSTCIRNCKGLPTTPNAAVDERFGLRRNLDTGNEYNCNKGYKMKGKLLAVCQSPGNWKVLFNCTPTKECASNEFQFDGEITTCIKLVTTRGITWRDARQYCQQQEGGDLVSIISKAKWDFIMYGKF